MRDAFFSRNRSVGGFVDVCLVVERAVAEVHELEEPEGRDDGHREVPVPGGLDPGAEMTAVTSGPCAPETVTANMCLYARLPVALAFFDTTLTLLIFMGVFSCDLLSSTTPVPAEIRRAQLRPGDSASCHGVRDPMHGLSCVLRCGCSVVNDHCRAHWSRVRVS